MHQCYNVNELLATTQFTQNLILIWQICLRLLSVYLPLFPSHSDISCVFLNIHSYNRQTLPMNMRSRFKTTVVIFTDFQWIRNSKGSYRDSVLYSSRLL